MRTSTKCSVAMHILVMLAVFSDDKLTSGLLAKSAGCNPVVVRNILGSLKKAGIVDMRRGSGGAYLTARPEDITMSAVFEAIDPASLCELMGLHPTPSAECPVGRSIYTLLERPRSMMADSLKEAMSRCTLRQIVDSYYELNPMEAVE